LEPSRDIACSIISDSQLRERHRGEERMTYF
jgi:hypothetical protein